MMQSAVATRAMPTMPVRAITKARERRHYIVTAYDSIEPRQFKIVVVLPELAEPTWVLRPGARKASSRNAVMALAVPALDALTLDLAQSLTRVATDYITVHDFPRADRVAGRLAKGSRVPAPWEAVSAAPSLAAVLPFPVKAPHTP